MNLTLSTAFEIQNEPKREEYRNNPLLLLELLPGCIGVATGLLGVASNPKGNPPVLYWGG